MARLEMRGANHFVGNLAVDQHARLALDDGLDLRLPLFRAHEAGLREQAEQFFGGRNGAEQLVERTIRGNAFAAFRREDERAAGLDDARARAHAFHALIQIHVERIAAVRGHDDIEGFVHRLHRVLAHELGANFVRLENVAGEDVGDLPLLVERDVEDETRSGLQRNVAQFLPERVAVIDAEGRVRIADVAEAVVAHHRAQAADAGHDAFDAAAEPREEMRLDEPGDDAQVRRERVLVEQGRDAVAHHADLLERVVVLRLVVQDAVIRHDDGCEHLLQFGPRVRPMRAELIQQRDVLARQHGLKMRQQPGNDPVIRRGARDVGEEDAHFRLRRDQFEQGQRANRLFQCAQHRALFIRQARRVAGRDHGGAAVGKFHRQPALAISEIHFHAWRKAKGRAAGGRRKNWRGSGRLRFAGRDRVEILHRGHVEHAVGRHGGGADRGF